jgi:hypothetical protein
MYFSFNYRSLILLIFIACAAVISFRYLKKRKFFEAIIVLAVYLLPLYALSKVKGRLTSLLTYLLQRNFYDSEVINAIALIILSPIMFFLIFCFLFGGYTLFIDDIDLIIYLKDHFRKKYIKSKVVGFFLMILGLLLLLLPMIYLTAGIWQFSFVAFSILFYLIGAICLIIPKGSENKIDEIIHKIYNRGKRK